MLPQLADHEQRARERLAEEVARYVAQGAGEGVSAAEAAEAWRTVRLVPRVLHDVTVVDLAVDLLGHRLATPVGVAPTTLQRAADPEGEVATARAAAEAGSLMVVSSNAGTSFEDIAATGVDWWLQMYVTADRSLTTPVVERAVEAGASAVVLTVDTPVVARKAQGARSVWEVTSPEWLRVNHPEVPPEAASAGLDEKARDLGPQDVAWLAARFEVPVVVKGVLHAADARRAVDAGASAVWVSNHGGRQLDRAVPTARALPAVVAELRPDPGAAVGADPAPSPDGPTPQVYVDGGIRSGLDALVARALGADAVFVGRPVLWGLAADGEAGVRSALEALTADLAEALTLAGTPSWEQVTADLLAV